MPLGVLPLFYSCDLQRLVASGDHTETELFVKEDLERESRDEVERFLTEKHL